jgi:hypothetical protein
MDNPEKWSTLGTKDEDKQNKKQQQKRRPVSEANQSINQSKFYLKSVHFITIKHKLSRAFQTDMSARKRGLVGQLILPHLGFVVGRFHRTDHQLKH